MLCFCFPVVKIRKSQKRIFKKNNGKLKESQNLKKFRKMKTAKPAKPDEVCEKSDASCHCHQCGRLFKSGRSLMYHVRRAHNRKNVSSTTRAS